MFWVLRMFRMLGMLLPTRMLRILGWPLLAAPGQPWRATERMVLEFHAQMLAARVSTARGAARLPHLIGIANR
jgi:hypothetical protein